MGSITFPALLPGYEPTRSTLHAYAHAVGAIPRAHGIAHPKWWHASLKVRPEGLATDPIPLPGGGTMALRMDFRTHQVVLRNSNGSKRVSDMRTGATGTEMAEQIIATATEWGLAEEYDRERFENDEPREYEPGAASAYFDAFLAANTLLARHRATLGDRVGPVQVWPHGFDLAFEWFGTRTVDADGTPAQLNLGFYPGGDPYFYSSPWPFDETLLDTPLPGGARWNTEGWKGAVLSYASVAGDPAAEQRILEFAWAVYDAAAPGFGI